MAARRLTSRVAVVDEDRCKPNKCGQECRRSCPVVKIGKHCIEIGPRSKSALISEELCIGCGICVKKCPFGAITIINLPKELDKDTTHRFGQNSFKLHRLPVPIPGQVLGLVGINGIGKSTALNILAGQIKPNLGRYDDPPDWHEILAYFHGSELQNYFKRMVEENLKPQVEIMHKNRNSFQVSVGQLLDRKDEKGMKDQLCNGLQLNEVIDRKVAKLSGGELQRVGIAAAALQSADVYMFDEPSSYLDVKQRLNAARVIKSLLRTNSFKKFTIICLPNFVFSYVIVIADAQEDAEIKTYQRYKYPTMSKTIGNFKLTVMEGEFTDSQIVVMLGENGTGKTTFIKMLAGVEKPDTVDGIDIEVPEFCVSYKPQKLASTYQGTVRQFLHEKIRDSYTHPQFVSDVMKPLKMQQLMDQEVQHLSCGQLQRVALCICLGKPADIYLIDEPSASLDSEQRLVASKVIKRFIMHAKKTAFIVEHDFIMATYLADRVIVYEGQPAVDCTANAPQSLLSGMNKFLSHLEITFRRDPTNFRPRINKLDSAKDREQKSAGSYYYL
ncbi:hypothetical protein OsI_33716 [Oryza sativa Indica Group]|uniref:Uncharacterized protein n=1 Tax=Oryza sativa subsp. indica TaxID=39946 RepID=B8BH03_ORYSI|nr:hypothetical protein OsI_33716 [Oryza sativa Indica Group]